MKKIFLLITIICISQLSIGQISAKTANGRNVLLNADGTWKYTDKEPVKQDQQQVGCEDRHTGNVTVINNNKSDIYFYYAPGENTLDNIKMVKVKAGTTKLIRDVTLANMRGGMYEWKAILELAQGEFVLQSLQGIANGTFQVIQCGNKEVEIDE